MPDNKTVTFDAETQQVVPKVPSVGMQDGAEALFLNMAIDPADSESRTAFVKALWSFMLAAAPTPAAQSAGQEAVAESVVCMTVDEAMRIVMANWGDKNAIERAFSANAAPVNGGERDDVVIDFDPAQAPKDFGTRWPPEILARRAADAQQVGGDARANEVAALAPILRGMIEGGSYDDPAELYAADFEAPDGDIFVRRAADLLEEYAALTSPAKVPDAVMRALDRMSTPLHDSRLSGLTAELDADNVKTIRDYVLSGASPAQVGDINDVVQILRAAWAAAEPNHSITQYPESYIATFADMARAVIAAYGCPAKVGGEDKRDAAVLFAYRALLEEQMDLADPVHHVEVAIAGIEFAFPNLVKTLAPNKWPPEPSMPPKEDAQ